VINLSFVFYMHDGLFAAESAGGAAAIAGSESGGRKPPRRGLLSIRAVRITHRTADSQRIASAYPDSITRGRSLLARLRGIQVTSI